MKKGSGAFSDHYSYSAYADPAMAATFDAKRFGGPIGQILLDDQEEVLLRFLGDVSDQRILDVGTGTGRAALALARRGAHVTGIDPSAEMLAVARARTTTAGIAVEFAAGDAHNLAYADRAFDAVVCLRVLMHVPNWRTSLAQLCRVAGRRVVFDYPALWSVAAVQAAYRRVAIATGSPVEAYRVFSYRAVKHEIEKHGFRVTSVHRQFVLPIALHKRIGSARFTRSVEGALAAIGLLRLAGSPVTIAAERCAS